MKVQKSIWYFTVAALLQCTVEGQDYTQQDQWGGVCNTGNAQSPIDIQVKSVNTNLKKSLKFEGFKEARSIIATNNAPSVKYTLADGSNRPSVCGGKLEGTYLLDSFHCHWPGEHTINGKSFDLECHFVFYSSQYSNVSQALGNENGLTVVGVLYKVAICEGSNAMNLLGDATSKVSKTVGDKATIDAMVIGELFPNRPDFVTYKGSLTTPDCNEVVVWNLFDRALHIERKQLEKMSTLFDANGQAVVSNNRKIQELNGRTVYYYKCFNPLGLNVLCKV